jgi:vacuolar-type H+-ATPase subunit C/Vma6
MIEAEALDDSLNLLGFTKYRGVVNRIPVSREIDSTIPMEAFLDSIYFKNLFKSMKKAPDEPILKTVIGAEIDFRNIYYLISYKLLDVSQRIMEESVVKPLYRFKDMEISNLIKAREEAVIEVLNASNYRWLTPSIAQALEDRSIDSLEYELSKLFKRYIDKVSIRNALGLGYVIWYLFSIEYEYKNLTAIAVGKELGWEESEIRIIY